MFRVIIAGTRTFNNYNLLKAYCDFKLSRITDSIEIVSGGSYGADWLGERYAEENGYSITRFPAAWDKDGKAAGPWRNKEMARYADALIAFWDGRSPGTKNMIDEAKARGLKIGVKLL